MLSHISTREFLRTREKCGEERAEDECFSHFPSVLKIPACLYNSTMHEEQVFYFFYKIKTTTKGQAVRQTTSLNSIGSKFGWQPMIRIEIISKSEIQNWNNFLKFKQFTFLCREADSNLSAPSAWVEHAAKHFAVKIYQISQGKKSLLT